MYGDLAAWRAYALARGDGAPIAAPDLDASAALLRAGDYIRLRYAARMTGIESGHPALAEAAYIAASVDLATPGFWAATYNKDSMSVLSVVGDIRWTPIDGLNVGVDALQPVSPMIDALLRPLGMGGAAVLVA